MAHRAVVLELRSGLSGSHMRCCPTRAARRDGQ